MVNQFKINRQSFQLSVNFHKNEAKSKFNTHKVQYLNFGEEDQMEIQGYIFNSLKSKTTWFFYIVTFGLLRLLFHWYPNWHLKAIHSRCSLNYAEKVLIIDNYKGKFKSHFVKEIKTLRTPESNSSSTITFHLHDGTTKSLKQVRTIRCKKLTYIWDDEKNKFIKLAGLENFISRSDLHKFNGQTREDQSLKRIIYNSNGIDIPVQTVLTLLILEALTPFYIFQIFSLIVWLAESYYYYTVAIVIMSAFGISTSIVQTRKNQKNLKGTVHSSDTILISRGNNQCEEIATTELVPGDVIIIPPNGCNMQCDAVVLSGNCVVNESMLTGESVPITKTPIPNNSTMYNVKVDVNHTLFGGTKIIQTRPGSDGRITAVVIRTGFLTTKGELVRSILYPPPADFKFDQDSYKFVGILGVIAILGVIYTIASKVSRNISPVDILIKALDLVTIAVPPALPAAMTVGKLYALNRLKNNKIFCINSRVINVTGSIDCICFDKTGTLTEDALDMWAVVPVESNSIQELVKDASTLPHDSILIRGMASCHSLNVFDGELSGDPLDVKMFESTGWQLSQITDEPSLCSIIEPKSKIKLSVVKLFHFSSLLQRMSVITRQSDQQNYTIFCKGSPEMIMSLSDPSTIPDELSSSVKLFTEQGYRVIALGFRQLSVPLDSVIELSRDDIERDLVFAGLIVLENKLKPQTAAAIETLQNAEMKIIMVTGDNIQTAVHVAKECKIIEPDTTVIEVVATKPTKYDFAAINYYALGLPAVLNEDIKNHNGNGCNKEKDVEHCAAGKYSFVVTGTSWANIMQYFPDLIANIVVKGVVFARMSGIQKQQLVEELKNLGYYVAMCGDGANDCGALKAAHVGISLSEAESSVASPFTSKEQNILCVSKVIREGRAALVTSFGVFKLMMCYSLTEFVSAIILYGIDSNLTSFQYLFIDICLILNFASFFGNTKAYRVLATKPPAASLLDFAQLNSIVWFMLVTIVFQIISYYYIQRFDWFVPFVLNKENINIFDSYENYAIFTISMFQYLTMAVVFSYGKPYRQAIYTNKTFTAILIVMTFICAYITLDPAPWLKDLLELKMPPKLNGSLTIISLAGLNFFVNIAIEDGFIKYVLNGSRKILCLGNLTPKTKYRKILNDLSQTSWPKISNNETVILNVNENDTKTNLGSAKNGFLHNNL